jgi:Integrase zinc binding domain
MYLLATGGPGRVIDVSPYGIIVRKAPLDGCEQILVLSSLRPRVLYLEHQPKSIGHPLVTNMFATMRQRYLRRNMYKDVEETVRQCTPCTNNHVQERKRVSLIKLFPANEPLEFVAIYILGPLPKTFHGNRFLLVISDRFYKLTRTAAAGHATSPMSFIYERSSETRIYVKIQAKLIMYDLSFHTVQRASHYCSSFSYKFNCKYLHVTHEKSLLRTMVGLPGETIVRQGIPRS